MEGNSNFKIPSTPCFLRNKKVEANSNFLFWKKSKINWNKVEGNRNTPYFSFFRMYFMKEIYWYNVSIHVWDHPFKTSANFSRFLTPTPLPSAIFYYYPSANLANF